VATIPKGIAPRSTKELESAVARLRNGNEALALAQDSYRSLLLRSIEMGVFADEKVMGLVRNPNVYVGYESSIISEVLDRALGSSSPDEVRYFVTLVRSRVAQTAQKANYADRFLEEILRRDFEPGSELRCLSCGYHFEQTDMRSSRHEVVREVGLALAPENRVLTGRLRDPWKSSDSNSRVLSIDHVVPDAALGPTDAGNLEVLCGFCNRAKKITVRHQETFPNRVAAALLAVSGRERGSWAYELAVFFAVQNVPMCAICEEGPKVTELTAIPKNGDRRWTSLLPTELSTRCYLHADEGLSV
jgi:hypothetical protein